METKKIELVKSSAVATFCDRYELFALIDEEGSHCSPALCVHVTPSHTEVWDNERWLVDELRDILKSGVESLEIPEIPVEDYPLVLAVITEAIKLGFFTNILKGGL